MRGRRSMLATKILDAAGKTGAELKAEGYPAG